MSRKKNIKKTELKDYLDIEEEISRTSKKYFNIHFFLVYNIETNLNNGDKKISTNGKNMTALEAISETIRDLTFVNHKEDYNNHIDFIRDSLLHYTDNNKKGGLLDKIRKNFYDMKSNVAFLEELLREKNNFSEDILELFKEFYEKNANNQTIKNFITNNYYDLRGDKKTKESKNFLDLGIDIGNLRKKINTNDVKPAKYPFYLENLIEAMKYRYLIEKDKYDEYIYYMGKIAEIYQEIVTISPYKWEEKALITQLLKLYNIDIKSAIKYIDVKKSKQKEESNEDKKDKRKKQISDKLKFLDNSVKEFEKLIQSEEKTKRILEDGKIILLKGYLEQVKKILTNYQGGNEDTIPLDAPADLELKVGEEEVDAPAPAPAPAGEAAAAAEPEADQAGEPEAVGEPEADQAASPGEPEAVGEPEADQADQAASPAAPEAPAPALAAAPEAGGGGVRIKIKRTPIKRR